VRGFAIIGSAIAHGVVFAALARWRPVLELPSCEVEPGALGQPVEHVEIVLVAPEVASELPARGGDVEPAVLDARRDVEAIARGGSDRARPVEERGSGLPARPVVGVAPHHAGRPEIASELPPSGPSGALAMRGPRRDLRLSRDALERIAGTGPPPPQPPSEPAAPSAHRAELTPTGGDRHEIRDRVAKVSVAPDGSVDMVDAPDATIRLGLPTPGRVGRGFARAINAWTADPYRATRVGRMQDLPRHLTAAPGACEAWGDPMCVTAEDIAEQWRRQDEDVQDGALVSGQLDLTAMLHRKLIGDPYASRKLALLDRTRDERIRIGTRYRTEQRDRSAELVRRNLEALWQTTRDPAARRAALFALWDECAEGDGPEGEAGARARAMVIGWIRARLPRGSADGYTDEELARLDARRTSRAHFAPYPER
jgi:hypothetical protein